jgi:hypothetical protein
MLRLTEEQKMNNEAGAARGSGALSEPVAVVSAALDEQVARIRSLNDRLRTTGRGGIILMTDGIAGLGREGVEKVFDAVRRVNRVDEGNDPHAEHDFGGLEIDGRSVFWKIDHYDRSRQAGSPDPADEKVTVRVLTVMLAEEY